MNRHERRAAEAQTRKSFTDYADVFRRAFKKVDEREIGEGWMRGAAAEAAGIAGVILHRPDEPPPAASACDIELSAAYGSQRFQAFMRREDLTSFAEQWPSFVAAVSKLPDSPVTGDLRHDARILIYECLVTNEQYVSGFNAGVIGSAIIWLARATPGRLGLVIGESHHKVHYEITDADVPGLRNYRLIIDR
jgi:hypothetical protein